MGLFGNKKKTGVTLVLRGFPGDSNTNKCLLMAAEQGIRLETQLVDVTEGACDGPEYRSLSPFGKVPCLKEVDFVVSGAPAILSYMDIKGKGASLNPKKASILGEQNYWVDLAQRIGDPAVQTLVQPLIPDCDDPGEAAVAAAGDSLSRVLSQLDALMTDGRQFVAGNYSYADIHWTAVAHLCALAGQAQLLESRVGVNAWYGRIVERSSSANGAPTYRALASLDEVRSKKLKSAA